jgi:hypothetical protein
MTNAAWGPRAQPGTGIDALVAWGPVINLVSVPPTRPSPLRNPRILRAQARDPRWGRTQEVPGEDPLLLGEFAREFTRGMQYGDDPRYLLSAATLKHFAVYSLEDYWAQDGSGAHYSRENIDNVCVCEA